MEHHPADVRIVHPSRWVFRRYGLYSGRIVQVGANETSQTHLYGDAQRLSVPLKVLVLVHVGQMAHRRSRTTGRPLIGMVAERPHFAVGRLRIHLEVTGVSKERQLIQIQTDGRLKRICEPQRAAEGGVPIGVPFGPAARVASPRRIDGEVDVHDVVEPLFRLRDFAHKGDGAFAEHR